MSGPGRQLRRRLAHLELVVLDAVTWLTATATILLLAALVVAVLIHEVTR